VISKFEFGARLRQGLSLALTCGSYSHPAVHQALAVTSGHVGKVQRFKQHRDMCTIATYDDGQRDMGGEVASWVASVAMKARE
jgi:hypothetical protein